MAKKNKSGEEYLFWFALLAVIGRIFLMQSNKAPEGGDYGNQTGNLSAGLTTTTLYYSGGGGGGGGGGSVPDEESTPEGGFLCETCDAEFFVNNPGIVTEVITEPSWLQKYVLKPTGHWNCNGTCTLNGQVMDGYNCVINPLDEIPEDGYDDITGERPECWCLPESPGPCNFYDGSFGEGLDDIICGGSCPAGEVCDYWINPAGKKEFCRCVKAADVEPCGFHYPENTLMVDGPPEMEDYEKWCYGQCEKGGDCVVSQDMNGDVSCGCKGDVPEEDDCSLIDTKEGSEWWNCYLDGNCKDGECIFNPMSASCECQSESDCGYHLSVEQVKELREMYGGDYWYVFQYIGAGGSLYCYGDCSNTVYECESVYLGSLKTFPPVGVYECRCESLETTTTTLFISPYVDGLDGLRVPVATTTTLSPLRTIDLYKII